MTKKRPKSFLENRKMDIYKCPLSVWRDIFVKKIIKFAETIMNFYGLVLKNKSFFL